MLVMPAQIDTYEEIAALSARMVVAARANNWEQLIALEIQAAALGEQLRKTDKRARLNRRETSRKSALIRRILEADAEVRRHTEPWMERLRPYLDYRAAL